MATVAFDTLKLARALRDAHFTNEQAEGAADAIAAAIQSDLATKTDLNTSVSGLKAEIAQFRSELKAEIAELRTEVKAEIAELRTELKAEIAEFRSELKAEITDVRNDGKVATASLRAEIEKLRGTTQTMVSDAKVDMIKWGVGIAIVQGGFIVGLLRLLH